jgi:hypothetical protein
MNVMSFYTGAKPMSYGSTNFLIQFRSPVMPRWAGVFRRMFLQRRMIERQLGEEESQLSYHGRGVQASASG